MPLNGETYVIARNRWGRPTLQHKLTRGSSRHTGCGQDMTDWSRSYQSNQIEAVFCKKSGCRA